MIATGTDIKPVEVLIFLRDVKSEIYYEQMKGRGVRTINPTDLRQVTPDATVKDTLRPHRCGGCYRVGQDRLPATGAQAHSRVRHADRSGSRWRARRGCAVLSRRAAGDSSRQYGAGGPDQGARARRP